ncbi:hypothetical protein M2480_003085 [Parabacteroides sp. PFB2-12]|uniref:hypothetical protein n=1 Tax=unclassified Parabacteroides TaxID=2649774 RepID=UPI002473371B|nr:MULTISPECIES: hypothetical protein [unclassified Parabacteroides]MDH6344170.1 hypothetical protein [Parabacteroides sp. PM6-13]MDH6392077.1 hypothetical protein [Parabacteroides sp. PFB2-12]
MIIDVLVELLKNSLEFSGEKRIASIKKFQTIVWNDTSINDKNLNGILSDIAYLLDFYEPNEEWRKESPNYYGDKYLEELIKLNIQQILDYTKNAPTVHVGKQC